MIVHVYITSRFLSPKKKKKKKKLKEGVGLRSKHICGLKHSLDHIKEKYFVKPPLLDTLARSLTC